VLPEHIRDFARSGAFATFTTLLPDGQPAAQVMWIDADDECLIINTETHRQKFHSVALDPRVVVCMWEPGNPYHQLEVRGRVVDVVHGAPARAHIDMLAQRYFGRPYDASIIKSARVILRIEPLSSGTASS
jgi:PPOX class probable F420-dependent enzyme